MTVKMINERITKALLKSKIIYSLELIYSHGLVSGITSLSMSDETQKPFNWTSQIVAVEKMLLFYQEMFYFFTNEACKF